MYSPEEVEANATLIAEARTRLLGQACLTFHHKLSRHLVGDSYLRPRTLNTLEK